MLENLNSFVQLARTLNFGAAARRLGITTSSLTRRIQALEKEMGYKLVERTTRHVALSEQGKQLLTRAEGLLQQAASLKTELAQSSRQLVGSIRVGAPVDLAMTVLGPPLAAFCRAFPFVTLNLIATQGLPRLEDDQLDVAFVVLHQRPIPDSTCTLSRIGGFARVAYASREYVSRHGMPGHPRDLAAHVCVPHVADRPETFWELWSGTKRARAPIRGKFATTSVVIATQAAAAGLGVAMLPVHLAGATAGDGLIRVMPEWEGAPALVFALTARHHGLARLSALIDWTRTHVPAQIASLERASRRRLDGEAAGQTG